jgi:REP element-mobilizing transposase RayT
VRSRYKVLDSDGIYFITSSIIEWIPVFVSLEYCDIIIQSLEYCKNHKDLKLYSYTILDDHFHLVCAASDLSNTISSIKKYTARQIINKAKLNNKKWLLNQFAYFKKKYKTKSDYQIWQEGFHPKLINSEKMLVQKIEYIHNNPLRRGLVDQPEYWKYSSARNYILNDNSIIKIDEW